MTKIDPAIAKLIADADLRWTISIAIPGDAEFPTLQLPEELLSYAASRAYPVAVAARKLEGRTMLYVQLESFDIAAHEAGSPGWAIPTAYTPRTDDERIAHALGFDEGWEDAETECVFGCDHRFAVFWRAALTRKRFGLTSTAATSLYVVELGDRERKPIEAALKAWAS